MHSFAIRLTAGTAQPVHHHRKCDVQVAEADGDGDEATEEEDEADGVVDRDAEVEVETDAEEPPDGVPPCCEEPAVGESVTRAEVVGVGDAEALGLAGSETSVEEPADAEVDDTVPAPVAAAEVEPRGPAPATEEPPEEARAAEAAVPPLKANTSRPTQAVASTPVPAVATALPLRERARRRLARPRRGEGARSPEPMPG